MGKTIKHKLTRNLFHNGERNHHNTLMKEYYQMGTGIVNDWRGLIDRRDYESDRCKRDRSILTKRCRTRLKRTWKTIVKDTLNEE